MQQSYIYMGGLITVDRRSDDWMAYVSLNTTLWGTGASIQAAIGDLIMTHGKEITLLIADAAREIERANPNTSDGVWGEYA